jgi:hypothetical protein
MVLTRCAALLTRGVRRERGGKGGEEGRKGGKRKGRKEEKDGKQRTGSNSGSEALRRKETICKDREDGSLWEKDGRVSPAISRRRRRGKKRRTPAAAPAAVHPIISVRRVLKYEATQERVGENMSPRASCFRCQRKRRKRTRVSFVDSEQANSGRRKRRTPSTTAKLKKN